MDAAAKATFARRREMFMQQMGRGVALIPAAPVVVRSADVEYPYRQNSDFYYLTGFPEPGALAVFSPDAENRFLLFVQPRDKAKEVWAGKRIGPDDAIAEYGADAAFTLRDLDTELPRLIASADRLYYRIDLGQELNRIIIDYFTRARDGRVRSGRGPTSLIDPTEILHQMRLIKEAGEIKLIREASKITGAAHQRAMAELSAGRREYELEAAIDFTFRDLGASGPAYPTIVASGPNAATLHHRTGRRQILEDELVLIDAGAEYEFYCADVSRTLPAGSCFRGAQRELYSLVLAAQKKAIEQVKPGGAWNAPHQAAVRVLVEGLLSLGLLSGDPEEIIEKESYSNFYMHRTSHWLGMDVHDVGHYQKGKEATLLEPGMVLTIEPGLYIGGDRADVAEQWRGIGIRIEDDVLVTSDGRDVLTAGIAKEIDEVEALLRDGGRPRTH